MSLKLDSTERFNADGIDCNNTYKARTERFILLVVVASSRVTEHATQFGSKAAPRG